MRINNNIMAMNANRQLAINNTNTQKSLEKLSSGLRINRAGDDAAGLAISEKMRAQIRGLTMASRNAQDGISLIQTAEGALTESHAILQRMRELAVQSANDTNVDIDRGEIQKEVDQLAKEISRIAETTEFNTQKLLNGEFKAIFHVGANADQNVELGINAMDAKSLKVNGIAYSANVTGITGLKVVSRTGEELKIEFKAAKDNEQPTEKVTETTAKFTAAEGTNPATITITLAQEAGDTDNVGAITATHEAVKSALESVADKAGIKVVTTDEFNGDGTISSAPDAVTIDRSKWTAEEPEEIIGIDVSTQEAANIAITTINDAIQNVSAERSKLGAMQNRLEHTIRNLDTSAENLQAAESRIRDVDMAKEMMEFTKQTILQQAATAMLAQANQMPQTVLQLLR